MNEHPEISVCDVPGVGPELRRLCAEMVGTFALTSFDCGAKIVGSITGHISAEAQALVPGFVVAAMSYSLGRCSGAHINPAVTLSFAARGAFPWRRVPGYWFAQVVGAVLAAWLLKSLFGDVEHLGATRPEGSPLVALVVEVTLTFMLVSVILGTATQHHVLGPNAALGVGAILIACCLVGKPISGASMNPARSLGPVLVGRHFQSSWIYVAGPVTGGLLAVLFAAIIHGGRAVGEREAASGDAAVGERRS